MPDNLFCQTLCQLPGIGQWTAEMLLIHCLERPDVLSYGDLAILRGLRMIYRHRNITKAISSASIRNGILPMVQWPAFTSGPFPRSYSRTYHPRQKL